MGEATTTPVPSRRSLKRGFPLVASKQERKPLLSA
jgi:hypothetical protein